MRTFIIVFLLSLMPVSSIGELMKELYYDYQIQQWMMHTPDGTAVLRVSDPDEMEATLEVKSAPGK